MRAYVAEFLGTFALLFCVVLAIASQTPDLGVYLLNGLVIAAMIGALGPISGAHFNPAVTLGFWLSGRLGGTQALGYVLAQLLGASAAVGVLALSLGNALHEVAFGVPSLASGVPLWVGVLVETLLTFVLVLVIFTTAVQQKNALAALLIGLAVTMGVLAGANVSGAAMNPARAWGSAIWGGGFEQHWVYWVGPLLGGALAAWFSDWLYRK